MWTMRNFMWVCVLSLLSLVYGEDFQGLITTCQLPNKCVPRILCNNGYLNRDGTNILNFRSLLNGNNNCGSLEICCSTANRKSKDPSLPSVSSTVPSTCCTVTKGKGENAPQNPSTNRSPRRSAGCGYSNKNGLDATLVNVTDEAQINEFPWVVIVLERSSEQNLAGGSLIAPNVVLTKARGISSMEPQNLIVRAGEWDTKTRSEFYPYVDNDVSIIESHSKYDSQNGDYNAALLILVSAYTIVPNISPICLAPANKIYDYTLCFVAGWGQKTYDDKASFMDIQKKIQLPIIQRHRCEAMLRNTLLGIDFQLQESLICAGGEEGKDACKGDGGGPLFCPMGTRYQNRYELVGIVNWGLQCGWKDVPAAYTSVSHIRQWIDRKMLEHSVDSSYFTA